MNLSTIVSLNELCTLDRIDGDSIDETVIYSGSIDMFLRTLIRHKVSLYKVLMLDCIRVENQQWLLACQPP